MAQSKTSFFCQSCGTQHTQWQGQCHACKAWNALVEEIVEKVPKSWQQSRQSNAVKAQLLQEIDTDKKSVLTPKTKNLTEF